MEKKDKRIDYTLKIFLLFFIILSKSIHASNLDGCSILNETCMDYYLNVNITNSTETICMNISANNITLDCQGHLIEGQNNDQSYGIWSDNFSNIIIKNCTLQNWDNGIYFENNANISISNVTTENNEGGGISVIQTNDTLIKQINSTNNTIGIYSSNNNRTTISDVNITYFTNAGLYSDGDENSDYSKINASFGKYPYTNRNAGILLNADWNINVSDTYCDNNFIGLQIYGGNYNKITNVVTKNNEQNGIKINSYNIVLNGYNSLNDSSFNSSIYVEGNNEDMNITLDNLTINRSYNGIEIKNAANTEIENSRIEENTNDGISCYSLGCNKMKIYNSIINNNGGRGIEILQYDGELNPFIIENTTANNNEDFGIYVNCTVSGNIMRNIEANSNTGNVGIELSNCDNLTIINATAKSNSIDVILNYVNNSNLYLINTEIGGVRLTSSRNNNLTNITCYAPEFCIQLSNSSNNNLSNITSNSSDTGVSFNNNSNNNTIKDSVFFDGNDCIIVFYSGGASDNKIYNNLFNSSISPSCYLYSEVLTNNYFNTTIQLGSRIYSNGNEIGGNYYTNSTGNDFSDACTDLNHDGICDEQFNLTDDGNSIDYSTLSTNYSLNSIGEPCISNSNCSSGFCVHGVCRQGSTYCGDGYCDTGEACSTDCPAATTGGGGFINTGGCTYNWTCTEWSDCLAGVQTRACYNKGTCKDNKGKPAESQSCIASPTSSNATPPIPTPVPAPAPARTSVPLITPTATIPLGLGVGLIAVIAISIVITAIILKKRRQNKRLIS